MAALVALGLVGLGFAGYMQNKHMLRLDAISEERSVPGYNRYILNQFQPFSEIIYSAGLRDNHIEKYQDKVTDGTYGITEHHIKLYASDPFYPVTIKRNLNV